MITIKIKCTIEVRDSGEIVIRHNPALDERSDALAGPLAGARNKGESRGDTQEATE